MWKNTIRWVVNYFFQININTENGSQVNWISTDLKSCVQHTHNIYYIKMREIILYVGVIDINSNIFLRRPVTESGNNL